MIVVVTGAMAAVIWLTVARLMIQGTPTPVPTPVDTPSCNSSGACLIPPLVITKEATP